MFIDIWDLENSAIKINKFDKDFNASNDSLYYIALRKIITDYGIKLKSKCSININYYRMKFKNSEQDGFNQKLYFITLLDCYRFLDSDTFQYLFESEDIDFIQITADKKVMFKYDNRR